MPSNIMTDSNEPDISTIGPLGDLETKALRLFDSLVDQGRLFYEPTKGEIIEDGGFKVSCWLIRKPSWIP